MADKDDSTNAPAQQTIPSETVKKKYVKPKVDMIVGEPLIVPGACGLDRRQDE